MKKIGVVILFLFLVVGGAFASSYTIRIVNADSVGVQDKCFVIDGNVEIAISTVNDNNKEENRKLTCDRVVINTDDQTVFASGKVLLTDSEESEFKGDSLYLYWEKLDVIVFAGISSTDRVNSKGKNVTFYSTANKISYDGDENVVFFTEGVVATSENQYWSIAAKNIALINSDLVFKNATIKIGYVPIGWLPFFFYPGTTLAFNPAMGISSDRGMFLNTTFEVYGKYPRIGETPKSSTDEDENVASSVFSIMKSEDEGEVIRDGITYRTLKDDEELPELEGWARNSSSYLALMFDAYEKQGLSLGFDSKNNLLDNKLSIASTGLVAFMPKAVRASYNAIRYYLSINSKLETEHMNFSFEIPWMSDPNVSSDYLNRNTVFGLDSAMNVKQDFPTTFSSISSYNWVIDGSGNFKLGESTFKLSSISSKIAYKWNTKLNQFKMTSATFPSFSASLSGNIFKISTEKNELAVSYLVSENLSDTYEENWERGSFSTTSKADLSVGGDTDIWGISYSQKVSTSYSYRKDGDTAKKKDETKGTKTLGINGSMSFSVSKIGLSYSFGTKIYSLTSNEKEKKSDPVKWDKDHVTEHEVSISKSFGPVSFSIKETLIPLDMILTPSITYSENGFNVSGSTQFYFSDHQIFKKGTSSIKFSYSADIWNAGIEASYKYEDESFKGFTLKQNAGANFLSKKITVSETYTGSKGFESNVVKLSTDVKHDTIYMWKNRIGFNADLNLALNFDFNNPYSSSFNATAKINFALYKFLDLSFSISSSNTSFYKYMNQKNKFSLGLFTVDALKSLNVFKREHLEQTGFSISSFNLSLVHYMEDWNLYVDASAGIGKENSKYIFKPVVKMYIKWNAIEELKVESSWNKKDGWEI